MSWQEGAQELFGAWFPLFVAMDPIGLVPIYLGMSQGMDRGHRLRIARQAVLTGGIVAVAFMFLGQLIFRALYISMGDFQVAGGIILFGFAARDMLFQGEPEPIRHHDFGVVPLGMPLIAGPATLSLLILLMNSQGVLLTLAGLSINLLLVILFLSHAERLVALVGLRGMRAFSKIVLLLLAAIAVNMIRRGLYELGVPSLLPLP
jgi:multiple antibiotic resistance protein